MYLSLQQMWGNEEVIINIKMVLYINKGYYCINKASRSSNVGNLKIEYTQRDRSILAP
jgi:hypothetical protein